MALTAAQTQTIYEACGLFAGGSTRYRYKFGAVGMAFEPGNIEGQTLSWSYSSIKTQIDTRIAALSAGEETRLGTYITTYDDTATTSLTLTGEVNLDLPEENENAANKIRQIIGLWVEAVPGVSPDGENAADSRRGHVARG